MEQPVGHHPRLRGRSKYNVRNRLVRGLMVLYPLLVRALWPDLKALWPTRH